MSIVFLFAECLFCMIAIGIITVLTIDCIVNEGKPIVNGYSVIKEWAKRNIRGAKDD
jgi:hypothetical protein